MAKKALINKQQRKPKFKVRAYTRCKRCGRPKSVYRKFGLCRICLRELAHAGELPGVTKAQLVGGGLTMMTDPSPTCSPASATPTSAMHDDVRMPAPS